MIHDERKGRLMAAMKDAGWDAVVLCGNAWQSDYLRYASGFGPLDGDAVLLLERDGAARLFVATPDEAERARIEAPDNDVAWAPVPARAAAAALAESGIGAAAGAPWSLLPRALSGTRGNVTLSDATAVIDALLLDKTAAERDALRRAGALADSGYRVFMEACRPGRAEYEVVGEVEAYYRSVGCPDNFQIMGSGGVEVRGMRPPNERRLAPGDLVTTELTPCVEGYYAQICRTLVLGEPTEVQRKSFDVFIEATEAGLAAVRPGVTASSIARAENDVFRAHGLGDYTTSEYTRVRGHGLGLFTDGKPALLEDVEVPIAAGMAIIVHPNTYHPDAGYMVLGDTVLVTEDGYDDLISTPRRLLSVPAQ